MRNVKIVVVVLTFVGLVFHLDAQISLGVKVGANFADTRVDGLLSNFAPEQTTYTGYTMGIIGEIPMSTSFAFRPELNYVQKGFIVSQSFDVNVLGIDMPLGGKAKTRLNYLEVPLLIKYSYGNENAKVYGIAGPSVGYATSAWLRPVATLIIDFNLPRVNINLDNNIYNRVELSGVIGAGGEVKVGHGKLFADGRYNIGFTNMLDNPIVDVRIKNQGWNVTAGYAYTF